MVVAGNYGFTLDVCVSVHPSSLSIPFPDDNYHINVNINAFSPKLVFALVLWRSGLGLLMDKFVKF